MSGAGRQKPGAAALETRHNCLSSEAKSLQRKTTRHLIEDLRYLCCGELPSDGRFKDIQQVLGGVIERYGHKALALIQPGASGDDLSMIGSYVARKLLEASCSAILARIDPVRFLVLYEYQLRAGGDYKLHERHPSSVSWFGDVIPEKSSNTPWANEATPDKFVRALLGGHLAETVWPKAIFECLKDDAITTESVWIEEVRELQERKRIESEKVKPQTTGQPPSDAGEISARWKIESGVLAVLRGRAQDLFSSLSKGVHLEFVVDERAILDAATMIEQIKKTARLITQMGYLASKADSAFTTLSPTNANSHVINIEQAFEI